MNTIPSLDKRGRFSLSRVKQEVIKIKETEKPHEKPIWIVLSILVWILFGVFLAWIFWPESASAAVFDNRTPIINNIVLGAVPASYRFPQLVFSSSTLQLEMTDITFWIGDATTGSTQIIQLEVETDKGTWYSSSTVVLPYGVYVTTTFSFTSPYPWASPGTDWQLNFDVPPDINVPTEHNLFFAASTSSYDHWETSVQHSECPFKLASSHPYCGVHQDLTIPPYEMGAMIVINESGLGGLTLFFEPPDPEDYSLSGTSSAMTQDFGFFGNMFRDLMMWLFTPNAAIEAYYNEQKTTLLNDKVPFAYFAAATSTIGSVSTTTDGAQMIVGATTTFGYFEFFNTLNIRASNLMSILDMIKFWFRVVLWAAFLFYVYYLIRDFKP